jgi:hypothetical protein
MGVAASVGVKDVSLEGWHVVNPIDSDRRPAHVNAEEFGVMIKRKFPLPLRQQLRNDRDRGRGGRNRDVVHITAVKPVSKVVGTATGRAGGVNVGVELVRPAAGVNGTSEVLGQKPPIGRYRSLVELVQGREVQGSRPLMIAG